MTHYVNEAIISILQWRHNERDGVSNHQPHDCLPNGLFKRRSKKTSKLRVTVFVRGIHRWPVNSPHKGPVTRKMFPFDDVIMTNYGFSFVRRQANTWTNADISLIGPLEQTSVNFRRNSSRKHFQMLAILFGSKYINSYIWTASSWGCKSCCSA